MNVSDRDVLEKGFRGFKYDINERTPHRISGLAKPKRLSRHVSTTHASLPDGEESRLNHLKAPDVLEHARKPVTPPSSRDALHICITNTLPSLGRPSSGLPPTPPTLTNSDVTDSRPTNALSPSPQFADAVRNALHSHESGLSTPGLKQPHTPDPSPPGTSEDLANSSLHPLRGQQRHLLREYPSSRAESFQTAREDQSNSESQLAFTPSPQPCSSQWLASTRPSRVQDVHKAIEFPNERSSLILIDKSHEVGRPVTLRNLEPRSRLRSASCSVMSNEDLDNHISYLGLDELFGPYLDPEDSLQNHSAAAGTKWAIWRQRLSNPPSAEEVNNLVYEQVREENIKRNSAMSSGNALPVGIIPLPDNKDKRLKRTTKRQSLREIPEVSAHSRQYSIDDQPRLKHKRAHLPTRSLEASPLVDSAAKTKWKPRPHALSKDTTKMTKLTYAEIAASSGIATDVKNISSPPIGRQHSLHRSPKFERLDRNPSLSRNSQDSGSSPSAFAEQQLPLSSVERSLRHFSPKTKLQNNPEVRRTSLSVSAPRSPQAPGENSSAEPKLRHFSHDAQLENNASVRRTSLDYAIHSTQPENLSLASPSRKSFDARFLHPSTTPLSQSQFSDRSEIEVCEAKGVNIYPHNNNSLLVIQHRSRPAGDQTVPAPNNFLGITTRQLGIGHPLFDARVVEPSLEELGSTIHIDSPLTNPRAAPVPPALKVIPPTPSKELDRESSIDNDNDNSVVGRAALHQRRLSLMQRARRYSENFVQPLLSRTGSLRKQQRRPASNEARPQNLSPLWKPRYFWEDYDSDEADFDDEPDDVLPRGGDTSDVPQSRQWVPRNMSVRMPGFRGTGGFLVGNSLGLDRYGTNSRRHHVLRKCASEEMLRRVASHRGTFIIPFSGGKRVRYVGMRSLRDRMSELKTEKEDRQREKRRRALRGQIMHAK